MDALLVLTLLGPDRPGLVERVAELVAGRQGNWLESRLARLGGHFAGIVRVTLPETQREAFLRDLKQLEAEQLQVLAVVSPSTAPAPAPALDQRGTHLEIIGQDRPGIVRHISAVLARHRVNVEELQTEVVSAPMTGETLFKASATVRIPEDCPLDLLRADLERIAHELMVDLKLPHWPQGQPG